MRLRVSLALLLLAPSCCEPPLTPSNEPADPPPLSSAAAASVWAHLQQTGPMPVINWVEGPCIDYPHPTVKCIAGGLFLPELNEVWVVAPPEGTPVTQTALSHELIHAAGTVDEAATRRLTGPVNLYLKSIGF